VEEGKTLQMESPVWFSAAATWAILLSSSTEVNGRPFDVTTADVILPGFVRCTGMTRPQPQQVFKIKQKVGKNLLSSQIVDMRSGDHFVL
jgi:hypothetical protein